MRYRLIAQIALLVAGCGSLAAQDAPADVHVVLSLDAPAATFRIGDAIRLKLTISGPAGYWVNPLEYPPTESVDEFQLSPDAGWTKIDNSKYSPDYASEMNLGERPADIHFTLNDYYRFDQPGRYTLQIRTPRVSGGSDFPHLEQAGKLLSNTVTFDIVPMTAEEEAAEVARLRDKPKQLAYLTGDAAVPEKVSAFLKGRIQTDGLLTSRNHDLVRVLLEREFRDPATVVSMQLVQALAQLNAAPGAQEQYTQQLARSLPSRPLRARIAGAQTVLALCAKQLDSEPATLAFAALRQNLSSLGTGTLETLLRVYPNQLKDPALAPVLDNILATHQFATRDFQTQTTLLSALLDAAPERARGYILEEIRRPDSIVDPKLLARLPDEELPEMDQPVLEAIRRFSEQPRDFPQLNDKTLLAARYGSPALLQPLREIYKSHSSAWSREASAHLLAYFARRMGEGASQMLEREIATQSSNDILFLSHIADGFYSPVLDSLVKKYLKGDNVQAASAAYVLSNYGSAADAALLQARLDANASNRQLRRELQDGLEIMQHRFPQ